jgi:hypothetical protein
MDSTGQPALPGVGSGPADLGDCPSGGEQVASGLIDLGELRVTEKEPRRWHRPGQVRRRVLLAALAVLVLLGVAGSALVSPGLAVPLWTAPAKNFYWGSHGIYAVDVAAKGLSSYDPVSGRRRWHLDTPHFIEWIEDVGAGQLLVMTSDQVDNEDGGNFSTMLVDEATGRTIATVGGAPWDIVPGGPIILYQLIPDCSDNFCETLFRIDRGSGAVVWSQSLRHPEALAAMPGEGDGIAIIDGSSVEIRSADTMAVTGRLTLPPVSGNMGIALYHDRLVTAQRSPDAFVVNNYPLAGAAPAWSVRIGQSGLPPDGSDWLNLSSCNRFLCLFAGDQTVILDRDTGAVRQSLPAGIAANPDDTDGVLVALTGVPNGQYDSAILVLSGTDASVIRKLPGSAIVPWFAADGRAMLSVDGLYNTGFRRVDRRGQVADLGTVPGRNLACLARGDLLACTDSASGLRVWHLPAF